MSECCWYWCWFSLIFIKPVTRDSLDHAVAKTLHHLGKGELERFLRTFLIDLHEIRVQIKKLDMTRQPNYIEKKTVKYAPGLK